MSAFLKAQPVWAKGKETEKNISLLFRAELPGGVPAKLRIAGHSDYQIFVGGSFVAQGPARAGHGFFRVDEIDLQTALTEARNLLCIVAAGYNINSFALTDQPAFLCAEVTAGGQVLAATGEKGFFCTAYDVRVQKVQRFSFQRPFAESYVLRTDSDRVFLDPDFFPPAAETECTAPKRMIPRGMPRSDYETCTAKAVIGKGCVQTDAARAEACRGRGVLNISETVKGFALEELESHATEELYAFDSKLTETVPAPAEPLELAENTFAVYDMGQNITGYVELVLTARTDTVIYAVFNEKLPASGIPDPGQNGTACEVRWALQGGKEYHLLSFEPYTYRYIQILSAGGKARIEEVSLRCEHCPADVLKPAPQFSDDDLRKIYDAAVETFRQNATDIFMDCPSRERAGWLCDSFFTSRTEYALTGRSRIEKAFLENFLMEDSFGCLPKGMLPMCYPSDHYDGNYIPNWAMWYLLELAEYRKRSGDEELIAKAKEKMYALAAFLGSYENSLGLLEKLDKWVFVEWSRANDFVQDVNFPTNMLYARFLQDLGTLYDDDALCKKSAKLKQTICALSFDGTFFCDRAMCTENGLRVTNEHTETAQYYAFFTGTATKESHPALWELLKTKFGSDRDPEKVFPDVPVSNAFIGNFLRLELLFCAGEYTQLLHEIRGFFLPMAELTGTLWEHMNPGASCCHGFASHVVYWLRAIFAED